MRRPKKEKKDAKTDNSAHIAVFTCVLAESAASHEVEYGFALAREATRTIRHQTLALCVRAFVKRKSTYTLKREDTLSKRDNITQLNQEDASTCVQHDAHLCDAYHAAEVGLAALAELALTTLGDVQRDNLVAYRERERGRERIRK